MIKWHQDAVIDICDAAAYDCRLNEYTKFPAATELQTILHRIGTLEQVLKLDRITRMDKFYVAVSYR